MLRQIVAATLSRQADVQLIENDIDAIPDVAIVGTSDATNVTAPTTLLSRWPRSRIVMLRTDGRDAVMYALQRTPLGEISPVELAAAISSPEP